MPPPVMTPNVTQFAELTQLLATADFESNGWITIESFTRSDASASVVLHARSFSGKSDPQRWRLAFEDLRSCRISDDAIDGIELLDEHVLLAGYQDEHVRLAFKGRVEDARHAIADLLARHVAVAGDWIPFDAYLNPSLPLTELLAFGSGVLAEGPRRFISAYTDVLSAHGLESSELAKRMPMRWDGESWEPERQDVQLLLLSPQSWLIGAGFDAQRLAAAKGNS